MQCRLFPSVYLIFFFNTEILQIVPSYHFSFIILTGFSCREKKKTIFSCLFEPLKCLITSGYASQSNRLEKWICVAFILENIESSCYSFRKKERETFLLSW